VIESPTQTIRCSWSGCDGAVTWDVAVLALLAKLNVPRLGNPPLPPDDNPQPPPDDNPQPPPAGKPQSLGPGKPKPSTLTTNMAIAIIDISFCFISKFANESHTT